MDVRTKLSLIPRPVVALVPRPLRDRWRTRWLVRERARRMIKQERATGSFAVPDAPREQPEPRDVARLADRFAKVETALEGVVARLDAVQAGIEQLDSRLSEQASGDAPSAMDDLRELVIPIEELARQLRSRDGADEVHTAVIDSAGEGPVVDVPTAEAEHASD